VRDKEAANNNKNGVSNIMSETESLGIAIIGLAGRFPQSIDLESFWELLKNRCEAIISFSDQELLAEGEDLAVLRHPNYVKAGTVIPQAEYFDADFFNMSARDAEITDPQQRLFIECVWQTLEQAGYPPATTTARIGLYAGVSDNTYQRYYLEPNREELLSTVGAYRLLTLSGKDYIATRTAYLLNLTGPAMTIQTACSTSLVAVHVACQSLLNFECDMVLAGGVSITFPQKRGYLYQEGMIMSKDGHCRAFDARAQGTTRGGGVGVVLLKRLEEALADGDTIHAVIRGSAVNNDGNDKIGYTAPSVKGQAEVILEAQAAAGVHPEEISYIEAHGTGTPLGDPIEIKALTQAFRMQTQRKNYCALGSVKTNIGHADTAAGIAGLLKTVLALKHRQLPPSLHFEQPNPHIDFANSPFFVNDRLRNWEIDTPMRCAGVSSFGIGGTNAHLIVAEAPLAKPSSSSRPWQLITLSAKTVTALKTATDNLAHWLQCNAESPLADVAYTLNRGRQNFSYRHIWVCSQIDEACAQLAAPARTYQASEKAREVVFLFPGQGSHYPKMTQGLYETEQLFRETLDHCASLLNAHWKYNLREVLYAEQQSHLLKQTAFTQPALFAVEYALAQLWMSWGIQPKAMLGHSLGEYVAACLAGVFSLEDALALVAARGQLIQSLPPGAMLALPVSEEKLQPWLNSNLSLAAVNGTQQCVLAGHPEAIEALKQKLQTQGIESRILNTSHGFHSHLLQPILAPFAQRLQQVKLQAPTIPYLSNFTGTWICPEQATDPDYWVQHLRHTVRFNENLQALFQHNIEILLEVGPGYTLSALAQQHPQYSEQFTMLHSLPRQRETENHAEITQILSTLGQLWAHGVTVNWDEFYAEEQRQRLPLPTYPFERKKYWIDLSQQKNHYRHALEPSQRWDDNSFGSTESPLKAQSLSPPFAQSYIAPRNPLETQLAEIWQVFLGISSIGVADDFFELGGDSLLAVQLIAHLRQKLQVNLGPQALLKAPNIAGLAQLIQSANTHTTIISIEPELLVKIKAGSPQYPALFMVHPIGGHVFSYQTLTRYLKTQQAIYGIQAQGITGQSTLLSQVTDMAERYIQHVRKHQPKGPYFLGGFSFGGVVAYEMAQQFTQQGEEIALLTLIDTPEPGHRPTIDIHDDSEMIVAYLLEIGKNIHISVAELRKMDESSRWKWFSEKIAGDRQFFEQTQAHLLLGLFRANVQAFSSYRPQPWKGKAIFFRAMEQDSTDVQPREKFWESLIQGGMELYSIPGNHITMNEEPNVQHLAQYLQSRLY